VLKKLLDAHEPEFLRLHKRPRHQLFFAQGEEYEAKKALLSAMKRGTSSLGVVDEYLDETIFDYLEALDPGVRLRLITGHHKPIFRTLFLPFAAQRGNVEARHCSDSHDRFIVLDETFPVIVADAVTNAPDVRTDSRDSRLKTRKSSLISPALPPLLCPACAR
jgi:hypothetical protein